MVYVFDESWIGLLTAVFERFERKEKTTQLIAQQYFQPSIIDNHFVVSSEPAKAKRVWEGLRKKIDAANARKLYCAFLSEKPQVYDHLFQAMIAVFSGQPDILNDYGNNKMLNITQTAKKVEREKHRMKAFIRLERSSDNLFFTAIEPDFNVLPLIATFFKNRYADQSWLIYDLKRKYGIYFDTRHVTEVAIEPGTVANESSLSSITYDAQEEKYKMLWQQYFKSTNIEARKNLKLHIQHVPKRYWKYLVEKQDKLYN